MIPAFQKILFVYGRVAQILDSRYHYFLKALICQPSHSMNLVATQQCLSLVQPLLTTKNHSADSEIYIGLLQYTALGQSDDSLLLVSSYPIWYLDGP